MAGLNKVQLIGHLAADPESKSFANGNSVVNFRMATSESWKDRDGQRQERTEWHSIAIFNENLGKVASSYLRKGSKVYIEGQLQTRKWQDQSGNDRFTTEIVLQKFRGDLVLLDSKADSAGGGGYNREDRQPAPQQTTRARPQPAAFGTDLDDDVPF